MGHFGEEHVGAHLSRSASALGLDLKLCDVTEASGGPIWRVRFDWWLREHRPSRLKPFSQKVFLACQEFRPHWMLCTGIAPLEARTVRAIGPYGIQRLNYLTDDPWNPALRASWFLKALPLYDHVFTTRQANIDDLKRLRVQEVSYLPFAYAPEVHFPQPPATEKERAPYACDLVFAGGADRDRIPWISAVVKAGFHVGLYGGYWDRFPETRAQARGHIEPMALRQAVGAAKVALCLVRRANRDGHSMRSFELPAMGACLLTEDTKEHREIFGQEAEAVVYFRTIDEMVKKLRWLLADEAERRRLAQAAYRRITQGQHTYRNRLKVMLGLS